MADEVTYGERTDSVAVKLRLLATAHAKGDHDLAMSLAESVKDTLSLERQSDAALPKPQIGTDEFVAVGDLPKPWAMWAEGWAFAKPLTLFETVGLARRREPVEIPVAFRDAQVNDLQREVRVARIGADGSLTEVVSQVHSEAVRGAARHCMLVIPADVPMHGNAGYLIFYGNPNAEQPRYQSDLRVTGEGYGLDVANQHYVANLSKQMGQLVRLRCMREHGLEIAAGGKGHGEPPTIDWSCDYVDPGHWQKLRMRNWAACPNFEVVRGPLCVRVRRWGFPHSPIHPLYTPSRMHMDQTYVFYAGQPWFVKEGRFDVIQDMHIEAMRDDEWVFSGYSFTNSVWLDAMGRLHEGAVPGEHANNMWGVGFYHRDSRDAFIALRLEHTAKNFEGLSHGGTPTLHYDGHGQLWARYPANAADLKTGASFHQKNAYTIAPFAKENGAREVEQLRHRLLQPPEVRADLAKVKTARATGRLARDGETPATAPLKPAAWDILREVSDDQIYKIKSGIVDLGYVYDLRIRDGVAHVLVTMPHRGRPVYQFLVTQGGGRVSEGIRERLLKLNGIRKVVVDFTWYPEWTTARLSSKARKEFGWPEK